MTSKGVILPSQVTFRSEGSNKYLCSRVCDWYYNYHRFESGLDIQDPRVAYEVFRLSDGTYRIKSLYYGKLWRRSPNWIWADAEDNDYIGDPDTRFECVMLGDNVIALRNLGNNAFCGGLTTEGKTDCLNAHYSTITRETRLIVEERVLRRKISNLQYRLQDSKIYGRQVIALAEQIVENKSRHRDLEQVITFTETIETSTTWNNAISVKFGASIEFEVAAVPLIASGKVQLSFEAGYEHQWGGTKTKGSKVEVTTKVVVPPSTNMKVSLICTKAFCDVPFSYTQTDLLPDGRTVSAIKHDGIFTGKNAYEFKVRSVEVDEYGQELKVHKVELASVKFK